MSHRVILLLNIISMIEAISDNALIISHSICWLHRLSPETWEMHGLSNVVSYFKLTLTLIIPQKFNTHDNTASVKPTLYNIFFLFWSISDTIKVTKKGAVLLPLFCLSFCKLHLFFGSSIGIRLIISSIVIGFVVNLASIAGVIKCFVAKNSCLFGINAI